MTKYGIKEWFNDNLQSFFEQTTKAIKESDADVIFYYIAYSFWKNSLSLFEILNGYSRSYPVAQGMRLLMDFEAGMDFLIKNPKNIKRFTDKVAKAWVDVKNEKKTWEESIVSSGNMHFIDDKTGEDVITTKRVDRTFKEDRHKYAFYCSYSHFNLYAIIDDAENMATVNDIRRVLSQRVSIISYYPEILKKYITSLNEILGENTITFDFDKFEKEFEKLLNALMAAKINNTPHKI